MKMKKLEQRRRARRWLSCEGNTNLRFEKILYYEGDLFCRSEVDRGSLDRIGSDAEP
jgi:hypothetical protein